MANDQLALITGGSGHLGFRTLVFALHSGYRIRAAVRSPSKAALIREAKSIQAHLDKLEFVVTTECERDLILPAVKGTVGILKSASAVETVKRVVITSSEVAIIPWHDFAKVESETIFIDKMSIPAPPPPYANTFEAYAASKVHALHASEKFLEEQNPHFGVINIMPSFILGANELTASTAEMRSRGTNRHALTAILGLRNPNPNPSTTVFIDDVARIQVLALDAATVVGVGGRNFLVSSGGLRGTTWNDAVDIVRAHFPDCVAVWPLDGDQPTKRTKVDSSRTEEIFGFAFADYETQVKSVVTHYLELLDKENA